MQQVVKDKDFKSIWLFSSSYKNKYKGFLRQLDMTRFGWT